MNQGTKPAHGVDQARAPAMALAGTSDPINPDIKPGEDFSAYS